MTSKEFILQEIKKVFPQHRAESVLAKSTLIQYLVQKMKSVSRSSKSRGSFGSIYPIYTLVEDYIINDYYENNSLDYNKYEGAQFTVVFNRQRELPFGEKLQNHGFNNRLNDDFRKYFAKYGEDEVPIIRNLETQRYWINEKLLKIMVDNENINIAKLIMNIIDKYIELKLDNFEGFFKTCDKFRVNYVNEPDNAINFIKSQLEPNTDARIFEIVSFVILKYYLYGEKIYLGFSKDELIKEDITLYKTGRTNANDGGIDFVMKPLGRFFQVTEVLNFKKYFLDIDKLNRFKITFVIKTDQSPDDVMRVISNEAVKQYKDKDLIKKYLDCFEEVITIPTLNNYLDVVIKKGLLGEMLEELVLQCKVEYNIYDE